MLLYFHNLYIYQSKYKSFYVLQKCTSTSILVYLLIPLCCFKKEINKLKKIFSKKHSQTISNLTLIKRTTTFVYREISVSYIKHQSESRQQSMGNNIHPLGPSGNLNSQDISTTLLPPAATPDGRELAVAESASFVRACAVTRETTGARRSPRTA